MDIISYKLNNLDINSDKIEICILPLILFEPQNTSSTYHIATSAIYLKNNSLKSTYIKNFNLDQNYIEIYRKHCNIPSKSIKYSTFIKLNKNLYIIIYIIYPTRKYTIEFNRSKKLSTKQYHWRYFLNFFSDNKPITKCNLNSIQQNFNLIHTFTIIDLFHILYSIDNNIFDINNG